MGSSGTGHFSDYTEQDGGSEFGSGGGSNADNCTKAFGDIELEEIARSPYYIDLNNLPAEGAAVQLRPQLEGGRLAIYDSTSNKTIGYLPTGYNFLRACLAADYHYMGVITRTETSPTSPRLWVDLAPEV
ncbi:MAG: hypothetical protein OCC45_15495 [Desulfotalea sp.]